MPKKVWNNFLSLEKALYSTHNKIICIYGTMACAEFEVNRPTVFKHGQTHWHIYRSTDRQTKKQTKSISTICYIHLRSKENSLLTGSGVSLEMFE